MPHHDEMSSGYALPTVVHARLRCFADILGGCHIPDYNVFWHCATYIVGFLADAITRLPGMNWCSIGFKSVSFLKNSVNVFVVSFLNTIFVFDCKNMCLYDRSSPY